MQAPRHILHSIPRQYPNIQLDIKRTHRAPLEGSYSPIRGRPICKDIEVQVLLGRDNIP